MNFSNLLSKIARTNKTQKYIIFGLLAASVMQSTVCALLLLKKPIIIERVNQKTPVALSVEEDKRSKEEILEFIKKSIKFRFNSEILKKNLRDWISKKELQFREFEQKQLKQNGIFQEVLIREVTLNDKGNFQIHAERLIRSEKAKGIIDFVVIAKINTVNRTIKNPYGLILERVSLKSKSKKENES